MELGFVLIEKLYGYLIDCFFDLVEFDGIFQGRTFKYNAAVSIIVAVCFRAVERFMHIGSEAAAGYVMRAADIKTRLIIFLHSLYNAEISVVVISERTVAENDGNGLTRLTISVVHRNFKTVEKKVFVHTRSRAPIRTVRIVYEYGAVLFYFRNAVGSGVIRNVVIGKRNELLAIGNGDGFGQHCIKSGIENHSVFDYIRVFFALNGRNRHFGVSCRVAERVDSHALIFAVTEQIGIIFGIEIIRYGITLLARHSGIHLLAGYGQLITARGISFEIESDRGRSTFKKDCASF